MRWTLSVASTQLLLQVVFKRKLQELSKHLTPLRPMQMREGACENSPTMSVSRTLPSAIVPRGDTALGQPRSVLYQWRSPESGVHASSSAERSSTEMTLSSICSPTAAKHRSSACHQRV